MEAVIGPFHGSRMSKMSTRCDILGLVGLRNDRNVGDAAVLHDVHQRGKCAEGNVLIAAQINWMMLGILNPVVQYLRKLRQLHGITSQKDILIAVHREHKPRLSDLLYRRRMRNVYLDA